MNDLLIDGDILCYRAAAAAQHKVYQVFSNGEILSTHRYLKEARKWVGNQSDMEIKSFTEYEHIANALSNARTILNKVLDKFDAHQHYKLYLTGTTNYRDSMAVTHEYKGNRKDTPKPYYLKDVRKYYLDNFNTYLIEGTEADDQLGIEHYSMFEMFGGEDDCPSILVSIDKDLKMIPGWNYDFVKEELTWIDEFEGIKWFYTQLLTGDTTDNIKGIHKLGIKTAQKLLKDCTTEKDMFRVCGLAYACAPDMEPDPESRLIENAHLLWIQREKDKLWTIPI